MKNYHIWRVGLLFPNAVSFSILHEVILKLNILKLHQGFMTNVSLIAGHFGHSSCYFLPWGMKSSKCDDFGFCQHMPTLWLQVTLVEEDKWERNSSGYWSSSDLAQRNSSLEQVFTALIFFLKCWRWGMPLKVKRCQVGFNWQWKVSCSVFYPSKNPSASKSK